MIFFNFYHFFCYFFRIFFYSSCRNEMELKFLFSLFLIHFQPILVWNEAIMVFFLIFLNFFFKFSITRQVRTKRNDNFYFLSFSAFFNLFWLEMKPQPYFLIFFNFLAILLEFSTTRQVGTERNDNFYFPAFTAFSNLFWLKMNP